MSDRDVGRAPVQESDEALRLCQVALKRVEDQTGRRQGVWERVHYEAAGGPLMYERADPPTCGGCPFKMWHGMSGVLSPESAYGHEPAHGQGGRRSANGPMPGSEELGGGGRRRAWTGLGEAGVAGLVAQHCCRTRDVHARAAARHQ